MGIKTTETHSRQLAQIPDAAGCLLVLGFSESQCAIVHSRRTRCHATPPAHCTRRNTDCDTGLAALGVGPTARQLRTVTLGDSPAGAARDHGRYFLADTSRTAGSPVRVREINLCSHLRRWCPRQDSNLRPRD